MEMRNLSELFRHSCISRSIRVAPDFWAPRAYWLGEDNWTTDQSDPNIAKIGDDRVQFHMDELEVAYGYWDLDSSPVDRVITVLQWSDDTYVVANPQTATIHRIQHCGTYGDGFYTKDEGTTERELIIKRNDQSWTHVYLQGKRIVRCDAQLISGEKFEWVGFNIPTNSNLKYQFEYELEPYIKKVEE